jgi:hypothetical protein
MSINSQTNHEEEVIHKLELKEHQAIQSSEGEQLANSNKYHSNVLSEFKFQYTLLVPC